MKPFHALLLSTVAALGWLVVAPVAQAQDVGVNAAIRNSVQTRSTATAALRPAQLRAAVRLGDQFVTGAQSQVQVLLRDRSTFTVGPNARMTVDRFVVSDRGGGGMTASVARGAFRFASGRSTRGPSRQAITTPVASIGVRGTIVEGAVGPEVLEVLRSQPGVPAFTGDEETMVLVVLRGPSGGSGGFDTPGGVDLERQGQTFRLDHSGQAYLVTSDGVFGPFFLPDEVSAALAALLLPPPNAATDSGSDATGTSVAVLADDTGSFSDGFSLSDPLDQYEPLPPANEDGVRKDFPFFPPPRP